MKHLLAMTFILILVSGSAWGQKAVNKPDMLLNPEWKKIYDDCQPDAELIENLRSKVPELKADVYFAYWCGDSKNHVPVFLKIVDTLNVPEFTVNFYEVERKAAADQKFYVESMMVERVPTFIFFGNGFELGRIIENPKDSILQDMMNIVF